MPWIYQGRQLIHRSERLIGNIHEATVKSAAQGKLNPGGDIAVADGAGFFGRMPSAGNRMFGQGFEMTITVAVDEWEAEYGPIQSAFP